MRGIMILFFGFELLLLYTHYWNEVIFYDPWEKSVIYIRWLLLLWLTLLFGYCLYTRFVSILANRQTILFSATIDSHVQNLARLALREDPVIISTDDQTHSTVSGLQQGYVELVNICSQTTNKLFDLTNIFRYFLLVGKSQKIAETSNTLGVCSLCIYMSTGLFLIWEGLGHSSQPGPELHTRHWIAL